MKCNPGGGDAVYGVGMLGAAVYYINHAQSFGEGVLGLFKALVWPAILVYQVLEMLAK